MKIRNQQGMSIIGFILILGLVIFASFITMRILPIYMEFFSVNSAMQGIAAEQGSARYSTRTVRTKMFNRLYVNYADANIKESDIQVKRQNGMNLHVSYEVRKPLMGNLDVIASFDKMVKLSN